MKFFLLIDTGGTKTTFHQYYSNGKDFILKQSQTYSNKDYNDFYLLLNDYLSSYPERLEIIAIAAAGVIKKDYVKLTNLDWEINKSLLINNFFPYLCIDRIFLLNDLEASTYYPPVAIKKNENILKITDSEEKSFHGNYSVISAGTGLGTGFATYGEISKEYSVFPGEGGHTLFSPSSNKQWELYEYYRNLPGSDQMITNEFFLSGEGLIRIYRFLCYKENLDLNKNLPDISTREIHKKAQNSEKKALDSIKLFFEILAGASMNIALTLIPKGGIFFSGGMIINFIDLLDKNEFINNFQRNSKMKSLLEEIPLYIINSSETPILGLLEYLQKKGSSII